MTTPTHHTRSARLRRLLWGAALACCLCVVVAWPLGWLGSVGVRAAVGGNSISLTEGGGILQFSWVGQKLSPDAKWNVSFNLSASGTSRDEPRWDWGFGPEWRYAIVKWSHRDMPKGWVEVRTIEFSGWFVLLIVGTLGVVAHRRFRRCGRQLRGECLRCGYATQGLASGAPCPECGGGRVT